MHAMMTFRTSNAIGSLNLHISSQNKKATFGTQTSIHIY